MLLKLIMFFVFFFNVRMNRSCLLRNLLALYMKLSVTVLLKRNKLGYPSAFMCAFTKAGN